MPYSLMICVLLLQQIPVWRLVQDLKIGSVDDPEYAFTAAFDVVVRNEVAYSVHENEQRLRMWDARGKLIREIGRSGRGPGEFSGPVRAGWRGDTLWIYDSRQSRISLFKPTGEFVRSITAVAKVQPGAKASSNLRARYLLADGTLLGQPTILASASSDNKPDQSAFVRFRESGEILDTLAKYEVRRNTVEVRSGDARMYSVQPFTDSPLPVIGGRGRAVYIINRDYPRSNAKATFRITKIGLRGDTLFDKRFEYEPKPVTDAQFDKLIEERVASATDSSGPRPPFFRSADVARRAYREAMVRPQFHPPISSASAGADGTLWLQREDDGGADRLWQVMDESGRFIGAIRIARNDRVHYTTRENVWVSQMDDLGVPYIVRYRVLPASRSKQ